MKTLFIFIIGFILSYPLFCEELTFKEKIKIANNDWKNLNFEFYLSPGVIADVGIGASQCFQFEKHYQEVTLILHADLFPHGWVQDIDEFYKIHFWGAKFRSTFFYNPDFNGFNWSANIGFQSIHIDIFKDHWYTLPDLAIGCGYSWKLKNNHHFRISLDAGIKVYISNLYLSYVW